MSSNQPRYQYSPLHKSPQVMSQPFRSIPQNIPADTRVVNISFNNIAIIEPGSFKHLNDCTQLHLMRNKISILKPKSFQGMENLQILQLSQNDLEQLNAYTFEGLVSLKTLYISSSKLKNINSNAFFSLNRLLRLQLNQNHLSTVNKNMFPELTRLGELWLKNNEISHIDKFAFMANTYLRKIFLGGNKLRHVHKDMFQDMYLAELDLTGNRIQTIEPESFSVERHTYLYLFENQLSSLGWNIFRNDNNMRHTLIAFYNIIYLDVNFIKCKRQNCWIFHGIDAGWLKLHVPERKEPQLTPSECNSTCVKKGNMFHSYRHIYISFWGYRL